MSMIFFFKLPSSFFSSDGLKEFSVEKTKKLFIDNTKISCLRAGRKKIQKKVQKTSFKGSSGPNATNSESDFHFKRTSLPDETFAITVTECEKADDFSDEIVVLRPSMVQCFFIVFRTKRKKS